MIRMVASHAVADSEGGIFFHGMRAILLVIAAAPFVFLVAAVWSRGIAVSRRAGIAVARWESIVSKAALFFSAGSMIVFLDLYRGLLRTWLSS